MSRKARPTDAELIRRLTAIKVMVSGTKGALPNMASELRREACESIDDLIGELA